MKLQFSLVLLVALLLVQEKRTSNRLKVESLAGLQAAIDKASPGDVIVLADGVYTSTEDVRIMSKGTKEQPITVTTERAGGAEIKGAGGFVLASPAAWIIIKGFKFTHAAAHAKSENGTSFCRWTENIFETPGKGDYLNVAGEDHEIDHNTFQHKNSLGKFIAIRGEGDQIARRLWIHHNYFHDFRSQGGANGAEALQFGLSGFSLSSSNSIVEHNLFEDCEGENELISVKASEVILRYNTIRDCRAQFTLRHGNRCQVYGNYFINTPGLRIFGDDHIVHSNHFENCSMAINVGNGDGEVADGAKLTSHDRPDRVLIAFNTLVNNKRNIVQTARKNGMGATGITFAYNVIVDGEHAADISGPMKEAHWQNNIIFSTQPGDMPSDGFESFDPMLVRGDAGSYHLQPRSKLRNFAKDAFPSVSVDMDGQPRSDKTLDAGADEISTSTVVAKILSPNDVGARAQR